MESRSQMQNMGKTQIGLHSSVLNIFQNRPTHASVFCSSNKNVNSFLYCRSIISLMQQTMVFLHIEYNYYIKLYKLCYQICFAAPDKFYLEEEGAKWLF